MTIFICERSLSAGHEWTGSGNSATHSRQHENCMNTGCHPIVKSFQINSLHVTLLSDGWDSLNLPSTRTTWPEEDASQSLDLPVGCLWEEVWRFLLVKFH